MLGLVAIAALLLLALKKPGSTQKKPPPAGQGGGVDPGQLAGAAAGIATTAVGLLKAAGVVAGGGTAATGGTTAATATGVGTAAAGGSGAAAGGSTAAAFAGYEGVSVGVGLGAAGSIGVAAIIAAVEFAIWISIYASIVWSQAQSRLNIKFSAPPQNSGRWARDLCALELTIVNSIVDPNQTKPPAVGPDGQPVTPSLVTDRRLIWGIRSGNVPIDCYVPAVIKLSAAETLTLFRIARWAAIERLRASNATAFAFMLSVPNPSVSPYYVAQPPAALEQWLDANFPGTGPEPYDDPLPPPTSDPSYDQSTPYGIGMRLAARPAELDNVARKVFGAAYPLWQDMFHFIGVADGLSVAAAFGYGFIYPGDEQFTRDIVRMSGCGWDVQQFVVSAGLKWLAVDPKTHWAVDIGIAHQTGNCVPYSPAQLTVPVGSGMYSVYAPPQPEQLGAPPPSKPGVIVAARQVVRR